MSALAPGCGIAVNGFEQGDENVVDVRVDRVHGFILVPELDDDLVASVGSFGSVEYGCGEL
jgi:hypothetical protein